MNKKIILIRHCQANGQEQDACLTEEGIRQAQQLKTFLQEYHIERIISSPFKRAVQTIQPLATERDCKIRIDSRLAERVLSTDDLSDWQDKLQASFENMHISYPGGESSAKATVRVVRVVKEIWNSDHLTTVFVTHGNLMALLIRHYQPSFGFREWRRLSNPDVFKLENVNGEIDVKRIWIAEL